MMNIEKTMTAVHTDNDMSMLLTFSVGKEMYGIETEHVEEIIGLQNITVMPQTRGDIKGLINLRGRIIPVLDMRLRFDMPPAEYNDRTGIIVISHEGTTAGLIVDKVSDVLPFPEISVVPLPTLDMYCRNSCVDRLGIHESQIIMILDCSCLIAVEEYFEGEYNGTAETE